MELPISDKDLCALQDWAMASDKRALLFVAVDDKQLTSLLNGTPLKLLQGLGQTVDNNPDLEGVCRVIIRRLDYKHLMN